MERSSTDYSPSLVQASFSGLLELSVSLNRYRDALILVGGWVPYLLLDIKKEGGSTFQHVGSIDIDLVVNPAEIGPDEYASIVDILTKRGWNPKGGDSLFSYLKKIKSPVDDIDQIIQVDFLAARPQGMKGNHRHVDVQQKLRARMLDSAPLAISHNCKVPIKGKLPDNGEVEREIAMADIVGCIGMKGVVLGERYNQKDAYDIYTVLENYEGGPRKVASAVKPYVGIEPLMDLAIKTIRSAFKDEKANGSNWVANFLTEKRDDEHKAHAMRAFQTVAEFLKYI